MADLSGFPSAEVQFDRTGATTGTTDDVLKLAHDTEVTDLIVCCHGWNNDCDEARSLYAGLAVELQNGLNKVPGVKGRKLAIASVLWPSKKFVGAVDSSGGAAAAGPTISTDDIRAQIQDLQATCPDENTQQCLDRAAILLPHLEDRAGARNEFADELRSLLDPDAEDEEDGATALRHVPSHQLMERLAVPIPLAPSEPTWRGGAAGGTGGRAIAPQSLPGGVMGAARNLLNYTTYYVMKSRAGLIGRNGLAHLVLDPLRSARPDLRLHLVGHSFGARLVSAAADALPAGSLATVTLLQAAFSHYGFAKEWTKGHDGVFRDVITHKKIAGPILITHTVNDRAVGIAYAIASRAANQAAAAVGGPNDRYGGLGRNGAQKTPERRPETLHAVGAEYQWQASVPHNLCADRFISSHSDVTGKEVAYAVLSAISVS